MSGLIRKRHVYPVILAIIGVFWLGMVPHVAGWVLRVVGIFNGIKDHCSTCIGDLLQVLVIW